MAAVALVLVSGAPASQSRPFKACLVTDALTVSEAADARAAEAGLQAAERHGVTGRSIRSGSASSALAGLRTCVRGGAELTIGVGYLMEAPMNAIATAYPGRAFAIVDASVRTLASRPRNVQGVLFRTEQAGYLVGYAAGLWVKEQGGTAVGTVGGLKIPPVDRYIAGFEAGATRAFPTVRTFHTYAQSLTNASKCRRAALSQIADGSLVELAAAGDCGAGVLSAARSKGVFGIGTDSEQGRGEDWVMTSAVKRIDIAVSSVIASARAGSLKTGVDIELGARDDGIGYGAWSSLVSLRIRAAVARQLQLLRSGVVANIPTTVS